MLSRVKFSFYPVKSIASSSLTYKVLNSRPLFKFSEEKPKQPLQNNNNVENVSSPLANETKNPTPYSYDPARFSQINDQVFLKQQEELEKQRVRDLQKKKTLSFRIPIFCCLLSLFIYYLWQTIPYSVVWKHFTTSEYINQRGYVHAIFLSSLSFQNSGHLATYYPIMVYSFLLLSKIMKEKHLALLLITNSLLTTATTYYFEKYRQENTFLLVPKVNGAVTPLCLSAALMAIKPNHFIFKSRLLPFFIIPVTLWMYEWKEYNEAAQYEVSRPVHFSAIVYGFLFGLVFKKVCM